MLCKNTGVQGYLRVGGLVGLLHGGNTVDSCNVDGGTVTGGIYTGTIPPHEFANKIIKTGGFVGDVYLSTGHVTIEDCSTTADLGGNPADYHETVGPFIGYIDDGKGILRVIECEENGNDLSFVLVSNWTELEAVIAEDPETVLLQPGYYEAGSTIVGTAHYNRKLQKR